MTREEIRREIEARAMPVLERIARDHLDLLEAVQFLNHFGLYAPGGNALVRAVTLEGGGLALRFSSNGGPYGAVADVELTPEGARLTSVSGGDEDADRLPERMTRWAKEMLAWLEQMARADQEEMRGRA